MTPDNTHESALHALAKVGRYGLSARQLADAIVEDGAPFIDNRGRFAFGLAVAVELALASSWCPVTTGLRRKRHHRRAERKRPSYRDRHRPDRSCAAV